MTVRERILAGAYRGVRPALFRAYGGDPELIHEVTIRLLGRCPASVRALAGLLTATRTRETTLAGIRFPGRVGVAAGLDKDGRAVRAWSSLGFAFAELGTVTAKPQPGNDRPRLFRLRSSQALLNRMGFNNAGAATLALTLSRAGVYRGNLGAGIPIGVSIGKTKTTPLDEAVPDYLASLTAVAPHADYVAINVSSPNTPGLRELQDASALDELARALVAHTGELARKWATTPVPVFVKVAPDVSWPQLDALLTACESAGVAGVIATNTTLERDGLIGDDQRLAGEAGGLSGRPLTVRAREVVSYIAGHTGLPIIGSGGVLTADDAKALFDRGASLVQLYTGFVYSGPALPLAIGRIGL